MVDTSIEGFKKHITSVLSAGTADKYGRNLAIFLGTMSRGNITSFEDLPPNLLSSYGVQLKDMGYSASTVQNHVYAVQRYLNWVRSQGEAMPVFSSLELPRIQFRLREVLTPDQVEEYLRLANEELDEPLRTAAMIAPCAGLRATELCSLQLEHLRRGKIQLTGDKVKETLLLRVIGKGNKERVVPLLDEGVELLTEYLRGWRRRTKGPWLFPAGHSSKMSQHPLHERTLRNAMVKLREPMGLQFTPHTMRRTYLTFLWRRGCSEAVLAKIAGHKDVNTLIRHYLALDDQDILNQVHRTSGGARLLV